jgi:hypothetical protein
MSQRRGGLGPQAEGAVDVHPCAVAMRALDQRFEWIKGAGVDVAGLKTKDRGACDRRQFIRPHAPLAIDRHAHDA